MAERAWAQQAVLVEKLTSVHSSLCYPQCFALILVSKGLCRVDSPQKSFSVRGGEALLIRPGIDYGLSMGEGVQGLCVVFDAEPFGQSCLPMLSPCPLVASFFEDGCVMTFLHFRAVPQNLLLSAEQMYAESVHRGAYYEQVLLCDLTNLLLQLCRTCYVQASMAQSKDNRAAARILRYIAENCCDTTLEAVAAHFSLR